jgi:para-nitrobenzyl esterase
MIVQTTKGKLEGIIDHGVNVFRGIPYAAPPKGTLRWRRPQDVAPWPGVRKADEFGLSCTQPVFASMDGTEPVKEMSEDCLYLNVWTAPPAVGAQVLRPVMVWIHGGGFTIGEGRSMMYNSAPLAKKGAVVVTLNYRLGHLGFFAHPAIDRDPGRTARW